MSFIEKDHWLTGEERTRIETAVREAEARTSAEIVPIVAIGSGRYHRAVDIAGVWCAMIAFLLLGLFSPDRLVVLWEGFVVLCLGLAVGAFIAHAIPAVKRGLASETEMSARVMDAAFRTFRTYGVGETAGRTGILIYVSLFERMAVVIGDTALADRLKPDDYASIRNALLERLKAGSLTEGLIAGIHTAADLLEPIAPRAPGDINEISNALRLLE